MPGGRYFLGVDVGTTFTAAAVRRAGRTDVVQLGNRGAAIPSVLLLRDDGELLTGDAARRRAMSEPDRVATEFKRRVGDPVPILVGGAPFAGETLVAKLLRWVVDHVTAREGGPPAGVAVTHPANWGPYKLDLVAGAVRTAGVEPVAFLSEPEAAARHYAEQERVDDGSVVAVYDLGGGTFDACVLRKEPGGAFTLLGNPEGIERLGGIDLDEAVLGHVRRAAPDLLDQVDVDEPTVRAALVRLREECIAAKEQLSSDTDAAIPVLLPGRDARDVRITRGEFESLVRVVLADTIRSLERALNSASISPKDLDAVLLVGGSSRVPLIGELVSSALGRPVAVDADPKLSVAQGAALAAEAAFAAEAAQAGAGAPAAATLPLADPLPAAVEPAPPAETEPAPVVASTRPPDTASPVPAPEPVVEPAPPPAAPLPAAGGGAPTGRSRVPLVAGAVVVLVALVGAVLLLTGGDDGGGEVATDDPTATTTGTGDGPALVGAELTDFTFPEEPFAHVSAVRQVDDEDGPVYAIDFDTSYDRSGAGDGFQPHQHVHLFYDVHDRATAGVNGDPAPCDCWLAYGDESPATDGFFAVADAPADATAICGLVATTAHEIADVDGDGEPDPDSGDCAPLPSAIVAQVLNGGAPAGSAEAPSLAIADAGYATVPSGNAEGGPFATQVLVTDRQLLGTAQHIASQLGLDAPVRLVDPGTVAGADPEAELIVVLGP